MALFNPSHGTIKPKSWQYSTPVIALLNPSHGTIRIPVIALLNPSHGSIQHQSLHY